MRHILKKMVDGEKYNPPATIEDLGVLPIIEGKVKDRGLGKKIDL